MTQTISHATRPEPLTLIELCRAIAAIMVVTFHAGGAFAAEKYFAREVFADLFVFGSSGVQFFFALSGFIITYVHFEDINRPRSLKRYLWRRMVRIYPIYWLIFAGVLCVMLLVPSFREDVPAPPTLLKSLTLIPQNPDLVGGTGAPVIVVAWSMQYEVMFYALFAVFIVSARLGAIVLLGCALWIALGGAGYVLPFPLNFMSPANFSVFAFGVLAALTLQVYQPRRPALIFSAGLLLFVTLAGSEVVLALSGDSLGPSWLTITCYGLGSCLIIFGLASWEQTAGIRAPGILRALGQSSYVLYLIHFPLISLLCKVLSPGSGHIAYDTSSFVIICLTCVGIAHATHLLVEAPLGNFLRSKRQYAVFNTSVR